MEDPKVFRITKPGREIVRFNPDGSYQYPSDITPQEMYDSWHDLLSFAGDEHKKAEECRRRHEN